MSDFETLKLIYCVGFGLFCLIMGALTALCMWMQSTGLRKFGQQSQLFVPPPPPEAGNNRGL